MTSPGEQRSDSAPAAADAPRRAPRLSRSLILSTAVDLVDDHGLAELTMRRLGSVLHVQAMSLYSHVPSREDLLDGMVEKVVDELYADPEVYLEPRHGWEDYLSRLAHGVRRLAFAHPKLFPLVATRPPEAPWVRPPLRSLRWMNSFLAGLVRSGFSDPAAATVYRAFTSFLLGHLLLDVAGRGADTTVVLDPGAGTGAVAAGRDAHQSGDRAGAPADGQGTPGGPDPLADYPDLRRLRPELSADHSDAEFAESLANLLSRLGELHTATPGT